MAYTISTAGDSGLLISFEQVISPAINQRITNLVQGFDRQPLDGLLEVIPAFASLLVLYDPHLLSYDTLRAYLIERLEQPMTITEAQTRIWDIPLVYGGEFGPDLETVAQHAGLTSQEVIDRHAGRDYLVYMLGFLPGFPYLGGLDESIHTPRLANPRLAIPAGSVGIGGGQTGIYPVSSPGGWQLIGRTPVKTYDPNRTKPVLFEAGDSVRFRPISPDDYQTIEAAVRDGRYEPKLLSKAVVSYGH